MSHHYQETCVCIQGDAISLSSDICCSLLQSERLMPEEITQQCQCVFMCNMWLKICRCLIWSDQWKHISSHHLSNAVWEKNIPTVSNKLPSYAASIMSPVLTILVTTMLDFFCWSQRLGHDGGVLKHDLPAPSINRTAAFIDFLFELHSCSQPRVDSRGSAVIGTCTQSALLF